MVIRFQQITVRRTATKKKSIVIVISRRPSYDDELNQTCETVTRKQKPSACTSS